MSSKFVNFFSGFLGVVIGCVVTVAAILPQIDNLQLVSTNNIVVDETSAQGTKMSLNDYRDLYKNVVKSAMPSVVGITTVVLDDSQEYQDYFDFFFGNGQSLEPRLVEGLGTGVIVDKSGYILTNSHVVDDGQAQKVNVLFSDGTTKPAQIKWNDSNLDLAIIKVEGDNYPVATLGNSDDVEVGDIAIAIGNPLGLQFERTVTQGIISGTERTVRVGGNSTNDHSTEMSNLLQTDASINRGNSGGPLLNAEGEIIGINTIKVGSGEGLGFSIPINTAKVFVDIMKKNGEIKEKPVLGISGITVSQMKDIKGLDIHVKDGVFVSSIYEGYPANIAGIKKGDVIIKLNGDKIKNMSDLQASLYKNAQDISNPIEIVVQRNKTQKTLKIKLMTEDQIQEQV